MIDLTNVNVTDIDIAKLRKWADALVSGEFTQGTNVLRTADNNFCCLGVLCELHIRENPNQGYGWAEPVEFMDGRGEMHRDPHRNFVYSNEHLGGDDIWKFDAEPSPSVMDGTGLLPGGTIAAIGSANDKTVWFNGLAHANDQGMTFPEIAGHIRDFADQVDAARS